MRRINAGDFDPHRQVFRNAGCVRLLIGPASGGGCPLTGSSKLFRNCAAFKRYHERAVAQRVMTS